MKSYSSREVIQIITATVGTRSTAKVLIISSSIRRNPAKKPLRIR